jgi:hypothetical protein
VTLLVGTRKGAFFLRADSRRQRWQISPPLFLGHIIHHMLCDPRDPSVMLIAAKTGHLGPTVFRSLDGGKTWKEASKPPAFPKVGEAEQGRAVEVVFWLTPGHSTEPGRWYAGTSPPGLFRTDDNGDTWHPVEGFNDHPMYSEWIKNGGGTPGGQIVHSIRIDPRNADHMYIAISSGGVFESKDNGKNWCPLNRGCAADFLPDEDPEYGHDPHCFIIPDANPDRLYQQNHCGIYRLDRPSERWIRIGRNMPQSVGDIGFPIVAHPRDADRVWVFPMDGTTVWPRTSPDGKPAAFMTRDGGETWQQQSRGLPKCDAYFTVKRQSMCSDQNEPLGLYFGTTSGEVWGTINEGKSWSCLVRYLPEIYSLSVIEQK